MPRLALLLLLLLLPCLNGCAAYGVYDDPRLAGTISEDTQLAAKIKTALMDESFTGGWSVAVYSFYNHVFLVGEVPADMQAKAVTIARRYKPRSVTPHWFAPKTSSESNMALAPSCARNSSAPKASPPPGWKRKSTPGAWCFWAWSKTMPNASLPSAPPAAFRASPL
jgi:hypothetical protein